MRAIGLLAILLVLVGCADIGRTIKTSSTTFHGVDHLQRGSISVMPIDKTQEGSLEFKTVSNYLLKKFSENGYQPSTFAQSQFVAYITYGIDNGKTTMTSIPMMGFTGGGTSYTSGTVSSGTQSGSYSGVTTSMPTYNVVGSMPVDVTTFKRAVNIDIFKKDGSKTPEKVYEIKAISSGSCGNIHSVLFTIIDGAFVNFPGENGKTKIISLPSEIQC